MVRMVTVLMLTTALVGCADMQVRKITHEDRMEGDDCDVKGFRYYLSRPYVAVTERIEVSRHVSLIAVDVAQPEWKWAKQLAAHRPEDGSVARQNAALRIASHLNPGSRGLVPVSEAEWALLQTRMMNAGMLDRDSADPKAVDGSAPGSGQVAARVRSVDFTQPASEIVDSQEGTASTGSGGTAGSMLPDAPVVAAPAGCSVDLEGKIEVFFLPDFDEQYAVHNRNCLAKSTYALQFQDGWQLATVNGNFDSTTVAVEVLNTIGSAIRAAQTVATAGLPLRYRAAPAPSGAEEAPLLQDGEKTVVFLQVEHITYIRPGFYRLSKPWEIDAGIEMSGCGLLSKMGLPTVTDVIVGPAAPANNVRCCDGEGDEQP